MHVAKEGNQSRSHTTIAKMQHPSVPVTLEEAKR
jgi:hypothetical protein